METISNILGVLGFLIGLYNLFKKNKKEVSKEEFKEVSNTVKEHKEILRKSRA